MKTINCIHCTKNIPEDALLCPYCGKSVMKEFASPMPSPKNIPQQLAKKNRKGAAITSLILGISIFIIQVSGLLTMLNSRLSNNMRLINVILLLTACFGSPLSIIGIILGVLGVRSIQKLIAIAGIVINSISILFWIIEPAYSYIAFLTFLGLLAGGG